MPTPAQTRTRWAAPHFLADSAEADPDGNGVAQWVEDDFRVDHVSPSTPS
jgi:hypothetical protein